MLHTLEKQAGDEQVNDGMDISLLRVSTHEVVWASAKRPLIYFQNHELKELKGSKFPIGSSFYESKKFEQHQITTQKDDIFYLFTDGITDQFDKHGKKFMIKHFRETLTQIHTENTATQATLLQSIFETWKKDVIQLDDVLVIGVRI